MRWKPSGADMLDELNEAGFPESLSKERCCPEGKRKSKGLWEVDKVLFRIENGFYSIVFCVESCSTRYTIVRGCLTLDVPVSRSDTERHIAETRMWKESVCLIE